MRPEVRANRPRQEPNRQSSRLWEQTGPHARRRPDALWSLRRSLQLDDWQVHAPRQVAQLQFDVSGQETAFLTARSIADLIGSSANRSFHSLGVSAATSLAGWIDTRCRTSTR